MLSEMKKEREGIHIVDKEGNTSHMHNLLGSLIEDNNKKVTKGHKLGRFSYVTYQNCKELLLKKENGYICCANGQFNAGSPSIFTSPNIKSLYDGSPPLSRHFLENIENIVGFNLMFSLTSFASSEKLKNASEKSMCYKVRGNIYHKIYSPPE